nr:hypothetical protein [Tanacetum cinerariifolium]
DKGYLDNEDPFDAQQILFETEACILGGRRWDLDGILSEIRVRESLLYTFILLRINGSRRCGNGRSINNKTTASGDGFEFTLRVSKGVAKERYRP